jgi:hypothetical protein
VRHYRLRFQEVVIVFGPVRAFEIFVLAPER